MPKRHLVRRSYEYKEIFKCGFKLNFPTLYVYTLTKENGPTRLGLVVSRKVGGAFLRNRFKRVIREFFRLNYAELPSNTDIVVVLKPAPSRDVCSLRLQLRDVLKRLQ
ncbi:MAG: ribonuclease P protein component [Geobacteraceae bacterium]|nr:ribonuclease P protein component [Geobacteraceae bacterium]